MSRMTSRERVITSLNHKEPDMVPIDFGGRHTSLHAVAHSRLKKYLGLDGGEEIIQDMFQYIVYPDQRLLDLFQVDVFPICAKPPTFWKLKIDDSNDTWVDEWGTTYIRPKGGYYYDIKEFIMKDFSLEDLENFKFPDPRDKGRIKGLREEILNLRQKTDKALIIFSPTGGFWEHLYWLRGYEQAYVDIAINTDFVERFWEKMLCWFKSYWDNILGGVGDLVDVVAIGEDLGDQHGPIFNPKTYRSLLKPYHKELVSFLKTKTRAKIYIHSCGSVYWAIPDFIECGIDILNPVQVSAFNMDSKILKNEFGNEICFWGGGCDSQNVLMQGTPKQVEEEVKRRIFDFSPNGGFVFASIHNIQANVPPENIVAMFETAIKYRVY